MDTKTLELLRELEKFAQQNDRMWNVPPETGLFLHQIVLATGAKAILEIGMSNGYSGIWFGSALRHTGGALTTLEMDPWKVELATENFTKAGILELVAILEGDATASLNALTGPYDIAFLDASKEQYIDYFRKVKPLIRKGGLLLADNANSHRDQMSDFLNAVEQDEDFESQVIDIGTGALFAVKI